MALNLKRIGGVTFLVLLLIVLALLWSCLEIVPVDKVGVKSNLLGQGVIEEDVEPGLCLVIPGVHKLDLMDPTVQELSFAGENAFQLTARDQYTSYLDITIFYRIEKGFAWHVYQNIGRGDIIEKRFHDKALEAIWKVMGQMETEGMYDSEKRLQRTQQTVAALNKALKSSHLVAESLLIRKVEFQKEFEDRLIRKQLLSQKQLLDAKRKERAEEQRKTQMIQRETEAEVLRIQEEQKKAIINLNAEMKRAIDEIEANARYTVETMLAEAKRTRREKMAEGEKLKELARAKGEKAINEAYASAGGRLLLTREMVENIEIGRIELNTNRVNPFDVSRFLDLLGAQGQ